MSIGTVVMNRNGRIGTIMSIDYESGIAIICANNRYWTESIRNIFYVSQRSSRYNNVRLPQRVM